MKDYKDLKEEFKYEFPALNGIGMREEVWNWFVSKLQEQEEKIRRESVEGFKFFLESQKVDRDPKEPQQYDEIDAHNEYIDFLIQEYMSKLEGKSHE